ncbi:hypothetical protein GW17_00020606 [Ensete ventricosum]|nr:hypothetical protein GW17_00020606 [Ensete ventricosum]
MNVCWSFNEYFLPDFEVFELPIAPIKSLMYRVFEPINAPIYVSSTLISLANRDYTADISLLPSLTIVAVASLRCHCSPSSSLLSAAAATVVALHRRRCHCSAAIASPLSLSVRLAASPRLVNSILLSYW